MHRRAFVALVLAVLVMGCDQTKHQTSRGVASKVESTTMHGWTYFSFNLKGEEGVKYIAGSDYSAGLLADAEVEFTWRQDGTVRRVTSNIKVIKPPSSSNPTP